MKLSRVLRSLFRQPSTTVVALVVLAIGIGATTAVFSVLYAVAFKPLPWPEAERVVQLGDSDPSTPEMARGTAFQLSAIDVLRDELDAFDSAAGYVGHTMTLTGFDEPVKLQGARVSVDLFRVLGVPALAGRTFDRDDGMQRREDLVVVSYGLARRLFENAEAAVGQTLELDSEAREVIGVMPEKFRFPDRSTEFWWPLYPATSTDEGMVMEMMLPAIARLAPGATVQAAQVQGQGFLDQRAEQQEARLDQRPRRSGARPEGAPNVRRVRRGSSGTGDGEAGADGTISRRIERSGSGPAAAVDGEVQEASSSESGEPGGPGAVVRERRLEPSSGAAEGAEDRDHALEASTAEPAALNPEIRPRRVFVLTGLMAQRLAPLRDSLRLLIGAVLLVLLMACTNVANLLLARGAHREGEMATRLSLGATRGNLARLLLAESLVLALAGSVLGVALAWGGVRLLRRLGPERLMDFSQVTLSLPVVAFALAMAFVSTVVFGLLPAMQASGARPGRALGRTGGNALGGIWRGRSKLGWVRSSLTLAQVAMAIVLLAGGGLLANSFLRLTSVDPGYDAGDLLTFRLAPPAARYQGEQRTELFERTAEEISSIPGVESSGIVNFLPLFRGRIQMTMMVEGREPPSDPRDLPHAEGRLASAHYFETMKIRLIEGRTFSPEDRADAPPVMVVNQSFVEQLFPDGPAIGQRIAGMGEIVGVVGDVLLQGLDSEPGPTFYQPIAQLDPRMAMMFNRMSFAVRTKDPLSIVPAVRSRIAGLDPQLAIEDPLPMESRLSESVATPRFFATVLGLFALVALILAVTGVYGVLAFNTSRRSKETGIRLAIGAQRSSVVWRAVFEGMAMTLAGIGLGVLLATVLSRALSSLLFGVAPGDFGTLAVVSLVLLVAAGLGCLVPALRAARIDPVVALREE